MKNLKQAITRIDDGLAGAVDAVDGLKAMLNDLKGMKEDIERKDARIVELEEEVGHLQTRIEALEACTNNEPIESKFETIIPLNFYK